MRQQLAAIVALLLPLTALAACSPSQPAGESHVATASQAVRRSNAMSELTYFDVPTQAWRVGQPAKQALLSGVLGFTSAGCPFLALEARRVLLAFPAGARGVIEEDGTKSIVDADGRVYGTDGETVQYGGGGLQKNPVHNPCPGHPELKDYWSVQVPPSTRLLQPQPK